MQAYSAHLDWGERLLGLANQRLVPLIKQYFHLQGELVMAVDQRLAGEELDQKDLDLVRDFIFNTLMEAIPNIPLPDSWKAIFEKWKKLSIEKSGAKVSQNDRE